MIWFSIIHWLCICFVEVVLSIKSPVSYIFLVFPVGPLPDMILPTSNCRTVLIALEAEAFAREGNLVDPEGGVGLLKFQSTNISASNYSYKRLNFYNFNR